MSGSNYDSGLEVTYRFAAAAVDTAAVIGRFIGPAGKTGRIESITSVVTVDVTVAASVNTLDTVAGLTTPIAHSIPISSAGAGKSETQAVINAASRLPADTVVVLTSGGEATAGDADIVVVVSWY